MKSIVYAIAETQAAAGAELPQGLARAPLRSVPHGDVAAIVSSVPDDLAATAGVAQAVEFAGVVDQLHRRFTVLPMRYGCFVHEQEQAREFLRRYERQFSDALAELEGCEEMGLRLLVQEGPRESAQEERAPEEPGPAGTQGGAYLESRRRHYAQKAGGEAAARRRAEQAQAAFSGLFLRSTWTHAERPEGLLISLLFLVKREQVAAFRDAFLRFQQASSARALCSGPWPPYGFVEGLAQPEVAAQADWNLLMQQQPPRE